MQRKTITIIGGGFSGSTLAVQLARLAGDQPFACDVHLVEPRPVPGPGLAYTARRPEYLLNVRAQSLSAFPDQPDHFQNWLRIMAPTECSEEDFCSRQSYGRYLQQLVSQVLEWPSLNGIRCQWHNQTARAVTVAPDGRSAVVQLQNDQIIQSDFVVLALGNFAPPPPATADLAYLAHPTYHGNPWAQGALRNIASDDTVLLIGTGLTAVDVLLGLRADGHQGQITVVSGYGRWPAAHQPTHETYPSFYAAELAGLTTVADVLRVVHRHLCAAREQGQDWRPVIDSLRPDLGRIWAAWPLAEQARFLRHLAGRWSVVRHRSPPAQRGAAPGNAGLRPRAAAPGACAVHYARGGRPAPDGTNRPGPRPVPDGPARHQLYRPTARLPPHPGAAGGAAARSRLPPPRPAGPGYPHRCPWCPPRYRRPSLPGTVHAGTQPPPPELRIHGRTGTADPGH